MATIGPASSSPEVIRELIKAGMDVARLNFSHGDYEGHAKTIQTLRSISKELEMPVTILQDLQGPKIRVGKLSGGEMKLGQGHNVFLVPEDEYSGLPHEIPIDYPHLSEEAKPGMAVLLADGLFGLKIKLISGRRVECEVVDGGILKNRKGVNFPDLHLKLQSLTEKDLRDLDFGLTHDIDWVSLSFVRNADDVRQLKTYISGRGYMKPVIAKIEKPQAVENIEEILNEVHGIMVARGDLGVEMSPEKVPMIQKRIIELCNKKGVPVITATQMLESMIHDPRPTRAEASDVANAVIDGTDAIMLSGETAMGEHPVKAVEMMSKIATEVESKIEFRIYPHEDKSEVHALSQAANNIEQVVDLKCIVVLTTSGRSARFVAAERPKTPIYAFTNNLAVYHGLNLLWGIKPYVIQGETHSFEDLVRIADTGVLGKALAKKGDKILILGGIPAGMKGGTNFLKIHEVGKE